MKPNLTKQYPFTGDYFSYTLVTLADGTVTGKTYIGVPTPVQLALSVNLLGELLIESETKMQVNGRLKNIVDRNNEEIYEAGEWEIIQTAPILSAIGTKDGYKYRADLIGGEI